MLLLAEKVIPPVGATNRRCSGGELPCVASHLCYVQKAIACLTSRGASGSMRVRLGRCVGPTSRECATTNGMMILCEQCAVRHADRGGRFLNGTMSHSCVWKVGHKRCVKYHAQREIHGLHSFRRTRLAWRVKPQESHTKPRLKEHFQSGTGTHPCMAAERS